MSISDEIQNLVKSNDLVPVRPRRPIGGRQLRRYMFLSRSLNDEIQCQISDGNTRFAELEADLAYFLFAIVLEKTFIKQLLPPTDGVWEIRSYREQPSIRVFGQFASRNIFIATSVRYRADLMELGSLEWKYEQRRTRHLYRQLLPSYPARTTVNAHKLFDGAIDDRYYDYE